MTKLDSVRELDGATLQDDFGRYYWKDIDNKKYYGYSAHMSGAWVCYTCGHLCECGE
jgi:hypothetical protein